jgi:hypothetical protein
MCLSRRFRPIEGLERMKQEGTAMTDPVLYGDRDHFSELCDLVHANDPLQLAALEAKLGMRQAEAVEQVIDWVGFEKSIPNEPRAKLAWLQAELRSWPTPDEIDPFHLIPRLGTPTMSDTHTEREAEDDHDHSRGRERSR